MDVKTGVIVAMQHRNRTAVHDINVVRGFLINRLELNAQARRHSNGVVDWQNHYAELADTVRRMENTLGEIVEAMQSDIQ